MLIKKVAVALFVSTLVLSSCQSDPSEDAVTNEVENQEENLEQEIEAKKQEPITSISDGELRSFAQAILQVELYSQEVQNEMINVIQNEGLSLQRFSDLQNGVIDPAPTEEENVMLQNIQSEMMAMQGQAEKTMEDKIVATGISIERYYQIISLIQQHPEMQQRVETMKEAERAKL